MTTSKERTDRIPQNERHNFVAFSQNEAYRRTSEHLLGMVFPALPQEFVFVDMATGTGLVPQLVGEMAKNAGKTGRIIGIDPDEFAIKNAHKSVEPLDSPERRFVFLQGYGQDTEKLLRDRDVPLIPDAGVDGVSIHDAIHEIPGEDGKRETLAGLYAVAKPGAFLTMNSAFTSEANKSIEYGQWKVNAMQVAGLKRDKSKEAIKSHSPEEYKGMVKEAGFVPVWERVFSVPLSRDALRAIAEYPEFVTGMFRDLIGQERYSLDEKSGIMKKALDAVLEKSGKNSFPRMWYEIVARKPLTQ